MHTFTMSRILTVFCAVSELEDMMELQDDDDDEDDEEEVEELFFRPS